MNERQLIVYIYNWLKACEISPSIALENSFAIIRNGVHKSFTDVLKHLLSPDFLSIFIFIFAIVRESLQKFFYHEILPHGWKYLFS